MDLHDAFHLHLEIVLQVIIPDGHEVDCAHFARLHFEGNSDPVLVWLAVRIGVIVSTSDLRVRQGHHGLVVEPLGCREHVGLAFIVEHFQQQIIREEHRRLLKEDV